jgi:hypothetical protein
VIDEYRIMVFPVLLGSGKRLFKDASNTTHLELVDTRTFESGVTVLTYRPGDRAPSSRYVDTFAWTGEQMRSWQAARTQNGCSRRSYSPTSYGPRSRRPRSETSGGVVCWIGTTRSPARRSTASVAGW